MSASDQCVTSVNEAVRAEAQRIERRLVEFIHALRDFRTEHDEVAGDEVLRFELICKNMFETFVFKDGDSNNDSLSPNLDTGDAIALPFPPFVDELRAQTERVDYDAHHYYGPESIEELATAALRFLAREGPPLQRSFNNLAVLPGAGTVHLYDAICRVLIKRPDDTIIVPELGYGFFLTQPHRAGGRVATVKCDGRGAVTSAALTAAIDEHNEWLWTDWRRDADVLFDRAFRRVVAINRHARCADSAHAWAHIKHLMMRDPYAWRSNAVAQQLRLVTPLFRRWDSRERAISLLRPPRVVAHLHIQPSVTGHVYGQDEVVNIASVLDSAGVAALEDIAYHSIRCRLRDLSSLQGNAAATYTMLGMSKPLAIANLRLGLLYVDETRAERVKRALESSTGYVSTLLQRALANTLDAEGFNAYVRRLSYGSDGYDSKQRCMHLMLTGQATGAAPDVAAVRAAVLAAAVADPASAPFADAFLQEGLSRWFSPMGHPTAGFFQVVSCAPLLRSEPARRIGVTSSFDTFALLALVFGLRTIPEESMRPGGRPGHRLRLTFSPPVQTVARLFLRMYGGMTLIEQGIVKAV